MVCVDVQAILKKRNSCFLIQVELAVECYVEGGTLVSHRSDVVSYVLRLQRRQAASFQRNRTANLNAQRGQRTRQGLSQQTF